jgi:hypothetical protein
MWSDNPTLHVNAFLNFVRNYFHLTKEIHAYCRAKKNSFFRHALRFYVCYLNGSLAANATLSVLAILRKF